MTALQFQELDADEARSSLKQEAAVLVAIFAASQLRLRRILSRAIGEPDRRRFSSMLQQLDIEISRLNREAGNWNKSALPLAYNQSRDMTRQHLISLGLQIGKPKLASFHDQALQLILQQTAADILTATDGIKTQIGRYIRASQQSLLTDRAISETLAAGVRAGAGTLTIAKQIETQLRSVMGEEKFVLVNGRHYTPEFYSQLIARTRIKEAMTQATVLTAAENGIDLVQNDIHAGACPICRTHMGRTYSISGRSEFFPPLVNPPPRHPHCVCFLIPVALDSLIQSGELEASSRLSLNAPTPKTEKEAQEWLDRNQDMDLNSVGDYKMWINRNRG